MPKSSASRHAFIGTLSVLLAATVSAPAWAQSRNLNRLLEMFLTPRIAQDGWTYFRDVQTKNTQYTPFIDAEDPPATWLNTQIMAAEFKPKLQPFYYDETKFDTYLPQLGSRIRRSGGEGAGFFVAVLTKRHAATRGRLPAF